MKEVWITAYPVAMQNGRINVPDELTKPDKIREYIDNHWGEIEFSAPYLAYGGEDFEVHTN
jgi:hypothetical protein